MGMYHIYLNIYEIDICVLHYIPAVLVAAPARLISRTIMASMQRVAYECFGIIKVIIEPFNAYGALLSYWLHGCWHTTARFDVLQRALTACKHCMTIKQYCT